MILNGLFDDKTAATAIEYSMIAFCVAVAAIVAMRGVGEQTAFVWGKADTTIEEATKKVDR